MTLPSTAVETAIARSSLHSLTLFPPVPIPNKQPHFCGCKATWSLVYDILPPTTAITDCATGLENLSANGLFCWWWSNGSKVVTVNSNYIMRCLRLVSRETVVVSAHVQCTPFNHAWVHVRLAATFHLHFWQNGRDLLRASVVTRGWNGYQKLIRVSTENWPWKKNKKKPRSLRDWNPQPFDHEFGTLPLSCPRSPWSL